MRVFISWSGERSKRVALALKAYLLRFLQTTDEPWCSTDDIGKGTRWINEVATALAQIKFGIVCCTPDNLNNPWLVFESGALAKQLDGRVSTLLVGFSSATDIDGPLSQFQHTMFNRADFLKLLQELNKFCERQLETSELEVRLNHWWPQFESDAQANEEDEKHVTPKRSETEKIEEILELVRTLSADQTERTADWQRIFRNQHTLSLGPFPANFRPICDLVAEANEDVLVACDFALYGSFSEPKLSEEYLALLKSKHGRARVRVLIPTEARRRTLQGIQFGEGEQNWRRLTSAPKFCERIKALEDAEGVRLGSLDTLHEFWLSREARVIADLRRHGVEVIESEMIPSLFFWIADTRHAIFSIPLFGQDAHEQAIDTVDPGLIDNFRSMWKYYESPTSHSM